MLLHALFMKNFVNSPKGKNDLDSLFNIERRGSNPKVNVNSNFVSTIISFNKFYVLLLIYKKSNCFGKDIYANLDT